jgi:hypothetical protein
MVQVERQVRTVQAERRDQVAQAVLAQYPAALQIM